MSKYRQAANGHVHVASKPCDNDSCVPVVVISPEDPEQVETLARAYVATWRQSESEPHDQTVAIAQRQMKAALRSLVTDPKPEEPQGLGAVVEDAEGRKWVRDVHITTQRGSWLCGSDPGASPSRRAYVDVHATRVLSAGWSE